MLEQYQVRDLLRTWTNWARDKQLPPKGKKWRQWLMLGGRGSGKTRAGAEWVKAIAHGEWGTRAMHIALIAPTHAEARLVMIEGQSGLLSVHGSDEQPLYESSKRTITWPNGAKAQVFSAEDYDGLRGPQFDAAWCDELAKWKYADQAWDMLQFALRLGENPVSVITTTPRPIPLIKKLIADPGTMVSTAKTFDNRNNLAKPFIKAVMEKYAETRLGRQELNGELLEDNPDAIFKRDTLELHRTRHHPELKRIVVAVDPPAGHGKASNACGIVCVGLGVDDRAYVLDDASVQGLRPAKWAARIVALYHSRRADRVVAEINQGGAMVEQVLRQVDDELSFRAVHATQGKKARAEPVAALYEQGRVSHVGTFAELEDEMCNAIGEGGKSPDRLDALVWAMHDLVLKKRSEPRVRVV
jgi:phage terminase large subunit-like protein